GCNPTSSKFIHTWLRFGEIMRGSLSTELSHTVSYQGTDLNSVLSIVAQTDLVAIVPKWLVNHHFGQLKLRTLTLPWLKDTLPCYLTWHESTVRDKGHQWMKSQFNQLIEELSEQPVAA
ncbi:LysR substrate-binding domain-containing protein, partial [Providencia rettgeri]